MDQVDPTRSIAEHLLLSESFTHPSLEVASSFGLLLAWSALKHFLPCDLPTFYINLKNARVFISFLILNGIYSSFPILHGLKSFLRSLLKFMRAHWFISSLLHV
jgi:hypothetical protein